MSLSFCREFKLGGEDGDSRLPYLNPQGAFLGGLPLLETDSQGLWRPRPREVLERLLRIGYGDGMDVGRRIDALASVARALNTGDRTLAAITLVHAELPLLPDAERARKMVEADTLTKYNPDEPRVSAGDPAGGQWTSGGGGSGSGPASAAAHRVDPTVAKKQRFVAAHLADARKAADQLHVPVENVLGLTAWEGGWGTGRFAVEGNNYLGIQYPAPYALGSIPATGSSAELSKFGSYADCLNSFIKSDGHLIQGVNDPSHFARNLQNSGKFGIEPNGSKTPGYVNGVAATIRGLRSSIGH